MGGISGLTVKKKGGGDMDIRTKAMEKNQGGGD